MPVAAVAARVFFAATDVFFLPMIGPAHERATADGVGASEHVRPSFQVEANAAQPPTSHSLVPRTARLQPIAMDGPEQTGS